MQSTKFIITSLWHEIIAGNVGTHEISRQGYRDQRKIR